MQEQRHYSKAPITEAIIDLRVILPEDISISTLESIHTSINDRFPTMEPIHTGSLIVQAGPDIKVDANQQQNGFLFRSKDNIRVFQATLSGFTFNRLAPYESWEEFRNDAKYLWEIYQSVCEPIAVTRVAVRFINRLDLPGPTLDLKDYLRTMPEVAPDLPQALSTFFMQLQIPQADLDCMLIVNEALIPSENSQLINILLDFDLFSVQNWQSDDEGVWHLLEKLRHRKNQVFEASITDKTRRLIA